MAYFSPLRPTKKVGILLVPGFPMLAFSAALVPFHEANRLAEAQVYEIGIYSMDGCEVQAEGGVAIAPTSSLQSTEKLDIVFVCAGIEPKRYASQRIFAWLRLQDRFGATLGAICTGTYILALAGKLTGYRCTIHWENAASFAEDFPYIELTNNLFEIDRKRFTCAGGTAAIDLILNIIANDCGPALAIAVSHQFQLERIRTHDDLQDSIEFFSQGTRSRKVAEAIFFIAKTGGVGLTPCAIAEQVGLSQRQLERLFEKHLQRTPIQYLTEVRLRRARELLISTELSVVEVSLASGFGSRSNFNRCYRLFFGHSPNAERDRLEQVGNLGV